MNTHINTNLAFTRFAFSSSPLRKRFCGLRRMPEEEETNTGADIPLHRSNASFANTSNVDGCLRVKSDSSYRAGLLYTLTGYFSIPSVATCLRAAREIATRARFAHLNIP